MFKNRQDAGRQLALSIKELIDSNGSVNPDQTVVVGLPRGGVPVAAEIALALSCPIDLLVSKKIRAPDNPELAIGAVSSGGVVVLDERIARHCGDQAGYKEAQRVQKDRLVMETKEQETAWVEVSGMGTRPDWTDKLIILADDGIATGMTTLAALRTVKQRQARLLWLATPVIPYDTFINLSEECDLLVALHSPIDFSAVGSFYQDFHQVEDREVIAALVLATRL